MGLLSDLLQAGAGYALGKEGIESARELGERGYEALMGLGEDVAERARFQPFTVTTGLGQTVTTPEGSLDVILSPEQEALQNQLLGQAQGLFEGVGVDPTIAQADLYEQMRAIQRPEEERQRLATEERMLAQGRLGLSSDAYGGSTPELLAQEQARQEAMLSANLGARQQAMREQGQALTAATGVLGSGYMPQQQALNALGLGANVAGLADIGRRTGAQLYGQLGQSGIEALMQGEDLAGRLQQQQMQSVANALLGQQITPQQQIAASAAGMTPQQIQNLGGASLFSNLASGVKNFFGIGGGSGGGSGGGTGSTVGSSVGSGGVNLNNVLSGLQSQVGQGTLFQGTGAGSSGGGVNNLNNVLSGLQSQVGTGTLLQGTGSSSPSGGVNNINNVLSGLQSQASQGTLFSGGMTPQQRQSGQIII